MILTKFLTKSEKVNTTSEMMLNEKGFYITILMYGLFSAIAVQKNVCDLRMAEGNIKPELSPKDRN
ncbi:YiaA/YiaB family inner membrane protein [Leptospira kanakyensis]|uniref:YiaAB two helix domain-containing protein n=1 Tax=Leptospira kanakyensis TaxID=2484968 RepID=A0A6N4QAW1_9LEPT|nr:YiaA/YiaB family inner membrane protein [Leptospira kanakyensis]MCW7480242.1 hypothetical protein [Leptospira kanakyensis]TGK50443.1 hypothetical protein EHQ11_12180 [Leptospira kanakyensis]TGK63955.1 hypothetical protein EHQ16_05840 [Leptospira kanakyensis]TGK69581.1 hypothetical protein EHQ18_12340 [Leptospira kanakyensis]